MSKIYISEVLRIAAEEIGYLEKATNDRLDDKTANAGPGNWTKYARDLWEAQPHFYQSCKNGYDWCAVFADWCRYMAGGKDALHAQAISFQTGPYGAGCDFAVRYYKQAGAWYAAPQPGDQIFFGNANGAQHTGLVERVECGVVYTIEGNSGNAVRRRSYSLTDSSILGYGRPAYDGAEKPKELPFVDVPQDAWYRDAVAWAWENGVTAGVDDTHFAPGRAITRAEVVQMLYKAR